MTGVVLVNPRTKFTNSSGVPISGGSVTVYLAGTTTVATTYQDKALTTENTSPITLDANGECLLWVDSANTYKILLADALGATVSGYPVDNVPGAADIGAAATAAAAATATAVEEAEEAAEAAETAQAAAEVAAEQAAAAALIFADTTAGLAAVASGEYFYVPSNVDGETLILYKDNAGVAEEIVRFRSAPELPEGMEVSWPSFASYPSGWFDTGRRAYGTVNPVISNGTPEVMLSDSNGAVLIWLDPSDMTTMFQDSAGTTPVTASGQSVGRIEDKSGNGNHFTASGAARPIYTESGDYKYLDFNGSSHAMSSASTSDFSTYSQVALLAAIRKTTTPVAFRALFESAGSLGASAFGMSAPFDASGGYTFTNAGTTFKSATTTATADNIDIVLTGVGDVSAQISMLRINGAHAAINVDNQGTGNYGTSAMYLGARQANSFYFTGRLYGLVARAGKTSIDQLRYLERYLASKCAPTFSADYSLPFVDLPTTFQDSGTVELADNLLFPRASAFAHADYTTTATEIEVTSFHNLSTATANTIGVFVNGVYVSEIAPSAAGISTDRVALASGSKTVSVVNGIQSRPNVGDPQGSFIIRVAANSPLTRASSTPANRVLIYGDSIAVGDTVANFSRDAWAMLLRAAVYPRSIAVEGYGFRSLYDDCVDASARGAFVDKVEAYFTGTTGTQTLYIAIGTNDYGLNKWSAASYGTAYAALLDDLNTALPSLVIKCQTPLRRNVETANGSGSTLGDYRTQISTAVGTRGSFCTLVDGTTLCTYPTNFAADLLHPKEAGHAQIATAVQALI